MVSIIDNLEKTDNQNLSSKYLKLKLKEQLIIVSLFVPMMKEQEDGTKQICFKQYSKTFEFSKIRFVPDKCNIVFCEKSKNKLNLQWISDICEDKVGDYYNKFRYESNNEVNRTKVISLFIDENKNITLIPYLPFFIEESEVSNKTLTSNELTNESLGEIIEGYSAFNKRIDAKRNLIARINILDCLASLEAQIDLLSEIVLKNVNSKEYADILEKFGSQTVNNKEKLLQTIQNNKSNIRLLQKEYFELKGDAKSNREGA